MNYLRFLNISETRIQRKVSCLAVRLLKNLLMSIQREVIVSPLSLSLFPKRRRKRLPLDSTPHSRRSTVTKKRTSSSVPDNLMHKISHTLTLFSINSTIKYSPIYSEQGVEVKEIKIVPRGEEIHLGQGG